MENQHRKIKGGRELNEEEIAAMNNVKGLAASVGALIDQLEADPNTDKRWLAIAKTDLQKGFLAAVSSIDKPEFF